MESVKRFLLTICSLFTGFVIASTTGLTPVLANEIVQLGWEQWAPFQIKVQKGLPTGLDIELINAIMINAGYNLRYKEMSWKRHLWEVKHGKTELAGGASKTPERQKFAYFSDPYRTESVVMYIRKGEAKRFSRFRKLSDLSQVNFRLGVVHGYYYGKAYEKLEKIKSFKAKLQKVTKEKYNIKKLMRNRLDGFLMDPAAATRMLKKMRYLNKVEILPVKIYSDKIYVMFSKKMTNSGMVNAFNRSLNQLKSTGEYQRIMRKYIKGFKR